MFATCIHFRGSGVECKALVDVETKRDQYGRVPCVVVRGITGELVCDRRELPTTVDVQPGPMATRLELAESGRCPTCKGEKTGEMEFNGNVLALPCRHVIWHARES